MPTGGLNVKKRKSAHIHNYRLLIIGSHKDDVFCFIRHTCELLSKNGQNDNILSRTTDRVEVF